MGFDKRTGYYTTREIYGRGCKRNIVLSPERGIGKTYGYKHDIVNRKEKTMLLYRQSPELEHARSNWTDDLTLKGPIDKRMDPARFRWDGSKETGYQLYIDDELKCYFRSISAVNAIKHETFPDDVCWIIHDEFIPLKETKIPGIENIGDAIEVILKTVEHDSVHSRSEKGQKPVRLTLYGNPFRLDSPLLSYYGVNPMIGYGIHKGSKPELDVAWELIPPVEGREQESINNKLDIFRASAFVEGIPKGAEPFVSVRIRDKYFALFRRGQNGIHWVTETRGHLKLSGRLKVYGTLEGLQESEISLESVPMFVQGLKTEAVRGLLRFSDLNVKYDFLDRVMEL